MRMNQPSPKPSTLNPRPLLVQVHWAVMRMNQELPYTHKDYHQELARALNDVLGTNAAKRPPLTVDCGNGVGAK